MQPTGGDPADDKRYKGIINAWCLYDWANSGFATVILAAIFPVYYRSLARAASIENEDATAYWSYTNAIAMVLIAVAGPILGAMADLCRAKKKFTTLFAGFGILGSVGLAFLGGDDYLPASAIFILAMIGFAGGNIFYESLLPAIARPEDLDRVSTRGYAYGYVGGGLLLALCLAILTVPHLFFLPDKVLALKVCFILVGVWWLIFMLPLLRQVPEPPCATPARMSAAVIWQSVVRFGQTFREIKRYRELCFFLVAFWIYNDGISTIIKLASAYGDEIGVQQNDLIIALLLTQFIGIPCAIAFGKLGGTLGAKKAIFLGLGLYMVICVLGYYMKQTWHFYLLACMVGLVQGGTQALSRSLFTTMVPKNRSAEFFGLFSTGAKFAGILGPVVFGFMGQWGGSSRFGILSIILFFAIGAILLLFVDERKGQAVAQEVESQNA